MRDPSHECFKKESLGKIKFRAFPKLAKLRWLGVVNFLCIQMDLVMNMQFIFGDDLNGVPCKSLS